MDAKRQWATTIVAVLVISAVGPRFPGVWAQEASCPPGWEWNQNSLGQNPCTVASTLTTACLGTGEYTIYPLAIGNYYPPSNSSYPEILRCQCNTVWYSLLEACSSCQDGIVSSWIHWIEYCTSVYVAQYPYPIPTGTAVPHWAFFNVTVTPNQTYSDALAMAIGRDPEATPSLISTPSVQAGACSQPANTGPSSNNSNVMGNNRGALAGGLVGSFVPLLILAVVVTVILQRRRRSRVPLPIHHMERRPLSTHTTARDTYHNVRRPQGQGLPHDEFPPAI